MVILAYLPIRRGAVTKISMTAPVRSRRSRLRTRTELLPDATRSTTDFFLGHPPPRQITLILALVGALIDSRLRRADPRRITPRMRTMGNGLSIGSLALDAAPVGEPAAAAPDCPSDDPVTSIVRKAIVATPALSVARTDTTREPDMPKLFVTTAPVTSSNCPSPSRSQSIAATVPSGSDAVAVKVTGAPTAGVAGLADRLTTGGLSCCTDTTPTASLKLPAGSVTLTPTRNVPADAKVRVWIAPVASPYFLSPLRSQEYLRGSPLGSVDPLALRVTGVFVPTGFGVIVRAATGGPFTTIGTVTALLPAGLATVSVTCAGGVRAGMTCAGGVRPANVPPGNVHCQLVGSPVEVSVNWTVPPARTVEVKLAVGVVYTWKVVVPRAGAVATGSSSVASTIAM